MSSHARLLAPLAALVGASLVGAPLVGARPLAAQAPATAGALAVSAENLTAAAEARGGAPRRDAHARPGDVVHFRLAFTNVAGRPVRGVTLADPIPAGMHFVPGSARAARPDAAAEYSADGGRSYSARPVERVVIDGRAVERPVPAERYTHVRWVVGAAVAPRAQVVAEFDARLAGGATR